MVRLLAFALISEPIFDWAFYRVGWNPFSQNVFLTLALGLLGIWGFETCSHRQPSSALVPFQWLAWMSPVATSLSAHVLNTDYGWYGVSLITLFYFTDFSPLKKESDSHRGWIRFLFMGGLTLLFLGQVREKPRLFNSRDESEQSLSQSPKHLSSIFKIIFING